MEKPTVSANEISHTEEVGMLNNSPVKMIRTKGGFWIAVGKTSHKGKEEALAAGSHSAIVKYNIEKQYPSFQPAMMKSANFNDSTIVDKHSHFLNDEMRKSGHDIYSVQNGNSVEFHITKHNAQIAKVDSHIEGSTLVVDQLKAPQEFSSALAKATAEKLLTGGLKKLKFGDK